MTTKGEAIGTPVFTWQSHTQDLLSLIQGTTSTKDLLSIERMCTSLSGLARARRDALREMKGKNVLDPD